MPDPNPYLDQIQLTTDWLPLMAPTTCNYVFASGAGEWQWCSNPVSGIFQPVAAGTWEGVAQYASQGAIARYRKTAIICYVKGTQAGLLTVKFTL